VTIQLCCWFFRYLSQPAEVNTPDKSPETPRKFKYTGRHKTQPITPEEKRAAEASQDVSDDSDMGSTSSIKDRYAFPSISSYTWCCTSTIRLSSNIPASSSLPTQVKSMTGRISSNIYVPPFHHTQAVVPLSRTGTFSSNISVPPSHLTHTVKPLQLNLSSSISVPPFHQGPIIVLKLSRLCIT